jgi:hypothetical protein
MTDNLYDRIVGNRSGLSWLVSKMPGFSGYMEHTARRTADRLIRDHVAAQLRQQHTRLTALERQLVQSGALSVIDETKSVKTKFQTLIDRIATDAPGYSGFFAAASIGPDELEAIYAFDEAMIRYADTISDQLDTLEDAIKNQSGIADAVNALDTTMVEANAAYDLRDDLLNGIA